MYNMDDFPLSAKQQNSTYNHNIIPDTQIKALDNSPLSGRFIKLVYQQSGR